MNYWNNQHNDMLIKLNKETFEPEPKRAFGIKKVFYVTNLKRVKIYGGYAGTIDMEARKMEKTLSCYEIVHKLGDLFKEGPRVPDDRNLS